MLFSRTEVIRSHHTSGGGYVSCIAKSHVPKSEEAIYYLKCIVLPTGRKRNV